MTDVALTVTALLACIGRDADRVVDHDDGRRDIYFFSSMAGKFAMISIDDDGAAILFSDRAGGICESMEIGEPPVARLALTIGDFLA